MKMRVAIVGLGMMGGSLGLALRKRRLARVTGVGRKAAKLARARRLGACDDATTDLAAGVREADAVVLCSRVDQIAPLFKKILPHLKPGAFVTDVGSVKGAILRAASEAGPAAASLFAGSHPLTGSEKTGVENARADLYQGATAVVCPFPETPARTLRAAQSLWRSVGSKPLVMPADLHDILVAQTSHLPHVLASALAQLISGLAHRDPNAAKILAGSFQDMTRIADADPAQWAEICSANQNFVVGALKSYRDVLNRLIQRAEKGGWPEWESFFSAARQGRRKLMARNPKFS